MCVFFFIEKRTERPRAHHILIRIKLHNLEFASFLDDDLLMVMINKLMMNRKLMMINKLMIIRKLMINLKANRRLIGSVY